MAIAAAPPPPPHAPFDSVTFLEGHVASILAFYDREAYDPDGGFHQYFHDDGHVYNRVDRHLVSSARFVWNYAQVGVASRVASRDVGGTWSGSEWLRVAQSDASGCDGV
jgi:mannose/cellobiose epimerase-like protein (N-acyl-D-glucosamine 2-epimerase family)